MAPLGSFELERRYFFSLIFSFLSLQFYMSLDILLSVQGALANSVVNRVNKFSNIVLNTYITKHHELKLPVCRVFLLYYVNIKRNLTFVRD